RTDSLLKFREPHSRPEMTQRRDLRLRRHDEARGKQIAPGANCESLWAFCATLRHAALTFAASTRRKQCHCSDSEFIQTANGGMRFVWNALLPTTVSPQSNS